MLDISKTISFVSSSVVPKVGEIAQSATKKVSIEAIEGAEKILKEVGREAGKEVGKKASSDSLVFGYIKKSGKNIPIKTLSATMKAQRVATYETQSLARIAPVTKKVEEGLKDIFPTEKDAFIFQDRLAALYEYPKIRNEILDEIVEKLNKRNGCVSEGEFRFATSSVYQKIKTFAREIFLKGDNFKDTPKKNCARVFGHINESTGNPVKNSSQSVYSFRAKSEGGIFKKLMRKFNKSDIKANFTKKEAQEAIGDLFGERIQMKSLTKKEAQEAILSARNQYGEQMFKSYAQFKKEILLYIKGESLREEDVVETLKALKVKQNEKTYNSLLQGIMEGRVRISEINNYGDKISSYFTSEQINSLRKAQEKRITAITRGRAGKPDLRGRKITGFALPERTKKLKQKEIRTVSIADNKRQDPTMGSIQQFKDGKIRKSKKVEFIEEGATKSTGYSSAHFNLRYRTLDHKDVFNGELQLRGLELEELGEIEHIVYNCARNKVSMGDKKLGKIAAEIMALDKEQMSNYEKYITELYHWKRLLELGIKIDQPIFDSKLIGLSEDFSYDGLKAMYITMK